MSDTIILRIPRNVRYYGIARMVVGGVAAGIELPYDTLDDVQLAIGSLLDNRHLEGDDIVDVHLDVSDERIAAKLGPFHEGSLDRAMSASHDAGGDMDLRRLLETIVDDVDVSTGDDGEWVTLTRQVPATV